LGAGAWSAFALKRRVIESRHDRVELGLDVLILLTLEIGFKQRVAARLLPPL
jgi:hypothetical protein